MTKNESENKPDSICELWQIERSLLGLAALLQNQSDSELAPDGLFGIGQIIKRQAHDLSQLKDMVGHGVMARPQCPHCSSPKQSSSDTRKSTP